MNLINKKIASNYSKRKQDLDKYIISKASNFEAKSFGCGHFNIYDTEKFSKGLELIKESLGKYGNTMFSSDNIICWNRNLSFLRDPFFLNILNDKKMDLMQKSTIWRTYILIFFAKLSSKLEGDFLELGTYEGKTAEILSNKIDFLNLNKNYILYDLFQWKSGDAHSPLSALQKSNLYEEVCKRFSKNKNVKIIKGRVPDTLIETIPEKIAFAHIDMNHWKPESEALEIILPKMPLGAVIVFDDYGWYTYHHQKVALDPIAKKYGQEILELPTAQGVLIKN